MIFNTWTFALFAGTTLALYWAVVPQRFRPAYLVAAGAAFYAYAVPVYLLLIAAVAFVTYASCRVMLRQPLERRGPYLAASVTAVLAVLVSFKYAHFFASIAGEAARTKIVPFPALAVPLAISFFTFEFVHVLADVARGKIDRIVPLEFAAFTLFFPTLVAGPIKRYESFVPQVRRLAAPANRELTLDLYRVALGLAKKYVVADSMTVFVEPLVHPGMPYGATDYVLATLAYAIKIYVDFSAYSDIAIGVSGLLGVRIPENFDMPYRAANISDFWRRWHASLSSWIRDYVFVPLGGSRGSELATARNLLLAMAIAGLWHGAAWTFVVWGLWHGAGLVVHRAWRANVVPRVALLRGGSRAVRALSTAATFAFVAAGWIFFAAPSLAGALAVFRGIFL